MPVGTLDQSQTGTSAGFGFGEAAGVKYRGQCFTPALPGKLGTLGFNRDKGSQGVKVYIDSTSGNVPAHSVGSELYSFEIPNDSIVNGYGEYDLPVPLDLTTSVQYCFYLAPWNTSTHAYADDYHDCHGVNTGTKEITGDPGFRNENLTFNYKTYMLAASSLIAKVNSILQAVKRAAYY